MCPTYDHELNRLERVSQEVFNSPYATSQFPIYAETIDFTPGKTKTSNQLDKEASESIRMLSAAAKEANIWLVGGVPSPFVVASDVSSACLLDRVNTGASARWQDLQLVSDFLARRVACGASSQSPPFRHRHSRRHHVQRKRDAVWWLWLDHRRDACAHLSHQ